MDENAKKTALRMIPYGLYVLTAETAGGEITAATVNFVTQTSFKPPLVVVGVKADSAGYAIVRKAGQFALNVLGKGQQGLAFGFFKPAVRDGNKLSGAAFHKGKNGAPVLDDAPAAVECRVVQVVEQGDHHIVIGEVTEVTLAKPPAGRPDAAVLEMKDLGEKVFYGG
jgi:flavin reductase (DIM6/NTAB) family NADH-FMN oxidoreductase RutF